jgi:hypothetical protein
MADEVRFIVKVRIHEGMDSMRMTNHFNLRPGPRPGMLLVEVPSVLGATSSSVFCRRRALAVQWLNDWEVAFLPAIPHVDSKFLKKCWDVLIDQSIRFQSSSSEDIYILHVETYAGHSSLTRSGATPPVPLPGGQARRKRSKHQSANTSGIWKGKK